MQQKQQKQEFDKDMKLFTQNLQVVGDDNYPTEMQLEAMNASIDGWNKYNPDNQGEHLTEFPEQGSRYGKKASALTKQFMNGEITPETYQKAMVGNNMEMVAAGKDPIDIGNALKISEPEGGGGGKDTALENKIAVIMKANPEVTYQEAAGVATGTLKIIPDVVSGTNNLVNVLDGTQRPLAPQGEGLPDEGTTPPQEQGETLWERAGKATGVVSAAKARWFGRDRNHWLGDCPKRRLRTDSLCGVHSNSWFTGKLVNNRRFNPLGEVEIIRGEINIAPKVWDNTKLMRARIEAVDKYLGGILEKELQGFCE